MLPFDYNRCFFRRGPNRRRYMMLRIAIALMLCASVTFAEPATKPATAPATKPSNEQAKFPTPAEMMERIKAKRAEQAGLVQVAYFNLTRPISERGSDFSLFGNDESTSLRSLIDRMHQARDDKDLRAVLITIGVEAQ